MDTSNPAAIQSLQRPSNGYVSAPPFSYSKSHACLRSRQAFRSELFRGVAFNISFVPASPEHRSSAMLTAGLDDGQVGDWFWG
jgi:hypothetical protein